ncbi:MAG: GNAT family protein [Pseudomonadota bacterium]
MVFLRSVPLTEAGPLLEAGGLYLRVPQLSDFTQWVLLREESRAFLAPWEPVWPADDLTRHAFRRRIKRYQQEMRDDEAVTFFAFRAHDDVLQGGLTLGNIRRGVTQAASLGYWVGERHARKGVMSRAVPLALNFAFDHLRLNRVEAACLPFNAASIALLEKSGFHREGYARRYLCINGEWQDHLLYGLVHDDPRPNARS